MSSIFTKSGVELLRQRVLQRVEEQLEQVGLNNVAFISSRVNQFPDERLSELLELIDTLSKALDKIIESATVFHKGVCVLHESAKQTRNACEWFAKAADGKNTEAQSTSGELSVLRDEAYVIEHAFDESSLRSELQNNVTKPARLRLRALNDLKNRVKEVDLLRLEAASKREAAEKLRAKQNITAAQLGKVEDEYADKQVVYEQALLKVIDEFSILKRDHAAIFAKAFISLKTCEYRFALSACASLAPLCGDAIASTLQEQSTPSPYSSGEAVSPSTPSSIAQDIIPPPASASSAAARPPHAQPVPTIAELQVEKPPTPPEKASLPRLSGSENESEATPSNLAELQSSSPGSPIDSFGGLHSVMDGEELEVDLDL